MNGEDIIRYNRTILYDIRRSKYHAISECLTENLRSEILKIFKHVLKVGMIQVNGKYTFFMDTTKLTIVRERTTRSTSNVHINFLCAMGIINKLPQVGKSLTEINKKFLATHVGSRPINNFYVKEYTEEELDRIENRCQRLLDAGVTRGNISFNKLNAVGLDDIAYEIYLNNPKSYEKKVNHLQELCEYVDWQIETKGYATKKDIYDNLTFSDKEIDKVLKIFRKQFREIYDYKRPNKETVEKFNLHGYGWIITKKEIDK